MTRFTDEHKRYLQSRPASKLIVGTVEFYHDDFGYYRLVANQYKEMTFNINGRDQVFQPVKMDVPSATDQSLEKSVQGSIKFGRIGVNFRNAIRSITPLGRFKPIKVTIRDFMMDYPSEDNKQVVGEISLFVASNGISMNESSVTVKLATSNYSKVTNKALIYDPEVFVGLING